LFCPSNQLGDHHLVKCFSNASIGRYFTKQICFFSHNPKKFAEFQKHTDLFNNKGNKILKNVKTYYISMLSPLKIIYFEYRPFIVKMHAESPKNDIASKNLSVLCDVELILGFPCLLPSLECVHKFIKIVQG
jgi:hypothetical protein